MKHTGLTVENGIYLFIEKTFPDVKNVDVRAINSATQLVKCILIFNDGTEKEIAVKQKFSSEYSEYPIVEYR